MKNYNAYAQLYLRLAIGLGFISAVLDRLGLLGRAGEKNIAWGNWKSFLAYTHSLLGMVAGPVSDAMGLLATVAETVFGLMLIAGFKTRFAATGSGILTLVFALSMTFAEGLKSPLNYSVFAVSAGAFVLAGLSHYRWSIDDLLLPRSK